MKMQVPLGAGKLVVPSVNDSNYPVRLGPNPTYAVLRAPYIEYGDWGIEGPEDLLMLLGRAQFTTEWESGGPNQMQIVRDSAKRALGDCPGMLYETNSRIMLALVRYWLNDLPAGQKVRITEPGYGKSTVAMYKHLLENNILTFA